MNQLPAKLPDSPIPAPPADRAAGFLALYEQHAGAVFSYLMTLTANPAAAEELLQETVLVMWREFDRFEPGTHFRAWARQIALNRVREFRRKKKREQLVFAPEQMEQLADERTTLDRHLEQRWEKFQNCLLKLRKQDRQLVEAYYGQQATADAVAGETGRSTFAIRKAIKRIRKGLFTCVGNDPPGKQPA